jgi:hypothetical protein
MYLDNIFYFYILNIHYNKSYSSSSTTTGSTTSTRGTATTTTTTTSYEIATPASDLHSPHNIGL